MNCIVLLMGVDGSGKSSLATMLNDELNRRGIRSKMVWASHRPYLLKPFILAAKFLLVRRHPKFENYEKHINAKRAGMKKLAWLRPLYFAVTVIDYLPQVLFKVYMPSVMGKVVICDRYYHDLVLDFGLTSVLPLCETLEILRWADRVLPVPNLHYWVDVPSEVAFSRKNDIPSTDYLEERADIYRKFAEQMGSTVLDGTLPLSENHSRVVADVIDLIRPGVLPPARRSDA